MPRLDAVDTVTTAVARRPRDYVRVTGPDAADYLQRMLSNDVELAPCPALLLTAKARVIAPIVVVRRADDDFLLLTEPGLGERVRAELLRFRFAAKVEVAPEEHVSHVVFGEVVGIYLDDRFVTEEGRLDTAAMRPVARMGYDEYAVVEWAFRMTRPGADVLPTVK